LLNLLLAIMNSSINSVQINCINAWKFQRTQVSTYFNILVTSDIHVLSYIHGTSNIRFALNIF
jgi:hypothetical protein